MEIRPLSLLDEGHYECRASNMYGTAVSPSTVLERAEMGSYPSSRPHEVYGLTEGNAYMIPCQPVKCFPKPSFSWALTERNQQNEGMNEDVKKVTINRRIQIDEQGHYCVAAVITRL